MPKIARELSPLAVKRLKAEGLHAVGGVQGLYLQISSANARSWVLRATVGKKRRDIGLGGYPSVTVALAREKARNYRTKIEEGIDPVALKREARSAILAAHGKEITFEAAAAEFISKKSAEWRNKKSASQWTNTLATHAGLIAKMQVKDVALAHVVKVLEPIWQTKTESAKRVRARIEAVLDYAIVRGYREAANCARWKGNLNKILPKPGALHKTKHLPAMPLGQVAAFMKALEGREGIAVKALQFLILTAARSGEVRGARWSEIDLQARTWTIPAERMKMQRTHKVPLSPQAIAILEKLPRFDGIDLCFPAPRGGMLSDMTLTQTMRRMEQKSVPHGFRSSFRDWSAEKTSFSREICEAALAHTVGNAVEAAYLRTDHFEKRRKLMTAWARFCETDVEDRDGEEKKVVSIGRGRK